MVVQISFMTDPKLHGLFWLLLPAEAPHPKPTLKNQGTLYIEVHGMGEHTTGEGKSKKLSPVCGKESPVH